MAFASLSEVKKSVEAGKTLGEYEACDAALEEHAYAAAETLFAKEPRPRVEARPIVFKKEAPAPGVQELFPATVPVGQDTVKRDTLDGVKAGDPVTVAAMKTRNDALKDWLGEYTACYRFAAAAIVCALLAFYFTFHNVWVAAVFAALCGYSYAHYLWNHYWAFDYMKVRVIMVPT